MGSRWLPQIQESFNQREMEILRLIKGGLSNHAIAQKLGLSIDTVKWYNRQIFGKLGVGSRTQAIEKAIEIGLINAWVGQPVAEESFSRPAAQSKHNLPAFLTAFIGRKKELADLRLLLHSATIRLVTILGPGGVGKTRLALRAAAEALPTFEHGAWLVDFAPVTDAGLVPQLTANTLGIRDSSGSPYEEALARYLSPRALLLVLDNCEHLAEACARLVIHLLTHCPRLRILATSREALEVEGEALYPLSTLSFPDAHRLPELDLLRRYDAVQLFVERAGLVCPGFMLTRENGLAITQVCQRLDGIPLALELAAARANLLSVEQIATRLEDCFQLLANRGRTTVPRHQTMQACLDWSYDLLSTPEQMLLCRLTVFSGGWTLEAAEQVCLDGNGVDQPAVSTVKATCADAQSTLSLPPGSMLDLLNHLVNKSMVVVAMDTGHPPGQEARYHLLEPIRQYLQAKLEQTGEVERLRDRHLAYFMRFSEKTSPKLRSAEQPQFLRKMKVEQDNLLAAMHWALVELGSEKEFSRERAKKGLRLGNALVYFWELCNPYQEIVEWLKEGLERINPQEERWNALRARTLYSIGYLLSWMEEGQVARHSPKVFEESILLFRACGDLPGLSMALARLAWMTKSSAQALALVDESITICRRVGERWNLAEALWNKMSIAEGVAALACGQESLELFRETGDPWKTNLTLTTLGANTIQQGDYAAGYAYLDESTGFFLESGNSRGMIVAYHCKGIAAYHLEDFNEMATCFQNALEIIHQLGGIGFSVHYLRAIGTAYKRLGDFSRSAESNLQSLSKACDIGDTWCICMALLGMAGVAAALDQPITAARLLGAVEAALEALNQTKDKEAQMESDRDTALVRAKLDESTFQFAWAEGRGMGLEAAIRESRAIAAKLVQ